MTQDERWFKQWKEVMNFMAVNKRRPSQFVESERGMRNWWKHQQKRLNADELKPDRAKLFEQLWEMGKQYKHVNQYV